MHRLHEDWLWVWNWLTKEGASRATVILVFITAWYALLTYRMAKAMNRQTSAMIQPVLSIDFRFDNSDPYPRGNFSVKNLGAQPVLLLDMRMNSKRDNIVAFEEYGMYERHIMPPADDISFRFDFTDKFQKEGFHSWSPGVCTYNLEVVASDLSEEVILAYRCYAYGRFFSVKKGMPLRVRWKFVYAYFRQRYYRVLYKFRPPRLMLAPDESAKRKARIWAWLKGKLSRPSSGPTNPT